MPKEPNIVHWSTKNMFVSISQKKRIVAEEIPDVLHVRCHCRTDAMIIKNIRRKREVPRDVRNSKVRIQFRRDWSRHQNTCNSQSGTGPGVRRSKLPLSACHNRCRCAMETNI